MGGGVGVVTSNSVYVCFADLVLPLLPDRGRLRSIEWTGEIRTLPWKGTKPKGSSQRECDGQVNHSSTGHRKRRDGRVGFRHDRINVYTAQTNSICHYHPHLCHMACRNLLNFYGPLPRVPCSLDSRQLASRVPQCLPGHTDTRGRCSENYPHIRNTARRGHDTALWFTRYFLARDVRLQNGRQRPLLADLVFAGRIYRFSMLRHWDDLVGSAHPPHHE